MSEEDKHFIKRYEELLDKGYCDCNEMNCIDNNSPRRILNIAKDLQVQLQQKDNIINELEKWCLSWKENDKYCYLASNNKDKCRYDIWEEVLDKLKELKGE